MNNIENILALLKQPGSIFVNAGGCSGIAKILKSLCDEIIELRLKNSSIKSPIQKGEEHEKSS